MTISRLFTAVMQKYVLESAATTSPTSPALEEPVLAKRGFCGNPCPHGVSHSHTFDLAMFMIVILVGSRKADGSAVATLSTKYYC